MPMPARPAVADRAAPFDRAVVRKVLLAAVALVLAVLYARRAVAGWTGGPLPYDLVTFLHASDDVLAGRNPFPAVETLTGDQNYVYPPLLALALAPLAVLPVSVATLLWVAVGVAAIAGALWLLEVRDPWVYAIALLFPATRDAVGAGTVGPLLVLAAALAWRLRDARPVLPALPVAVSVALKPFTWPLAVWLAATRRLRAAVLAVVLAIGVALASWLVVGFDGLGEYPELLRRLSELEADRSYSLVAVADAVWLGNTVGAAASIVVGGVLLVLAVLLGRGEGADADRRALTASIAAALALSPIVWIHYLVLLLVPLALARPRFSPLWLVVLVPLAPRAVGWEPKGWPEGDALSLAVVLGVAIVVLVATLRPAPR
jgi:alpha-1,2-mannosyltransferase